MKKYFSLLVVAVLSFASCSKDGQDGKVWVRIENTTTQVLMNASTTNVDFGDIQPGAVTNYKLVTDPIYMAYCHFTIEGEITTRGPLICLMPLPPPFPSGHYTFKVRPTNAASVYWTESIKD